MKVIYDPEHKACAVRFDKEDSIYMYQDEDGLEIHSCKGGKPEMVEELLLFDIEDDDL
jgi:hypothetical protein